MIDCDSGGPKMITEPQSYPHDILDEECGTQQPRATLQPDSAQTLPNELQLELEWSVHCRDYGNAN